MVTNSRGRSLQIQAENPDLRDITPVLRDTTSTGVFSLCCQAENIGENFHRCHQMF